MTLKSTAKLAAAIVGVSMVMSVALPAIASASALSAAQVSAIVSLLQSFGADQSTINNVQASLTGGTVTTTTTTGTTMSSGYTFNTNLTVGSTGVDVMNLQKVLNMNSATMVASSGAGSPGNESSFFGPATKAAVMKFQTAHGISPVSGYVGALTRAALNSMNTTTTTTGGTTTTTTTGTTLPTGGALTVTAGQQPVNSLAPKGASRVPFTNIVLTAGANDVTVNSITVQRSGLAQDAALNGVVLLNSQGLQIGIAKTLNSNHQAIVGDPFVIKAGTSQVITIAGNMASDLSAYTGQVLSLDVVAINTTASVSGSLPITGASQTLNNSLTIGTATINTSSYDPNTYGTQPIGTTGYRFSGLKITAGSAEDLTFKSIRWNQTGSVGSTDLANVVTVINGTSYPTTVSADGKYYSSVFPSGIVIPKGNSVDVYIQGDIVGSGASGRTSEFDIYKNTDIYLTGNTYGYGVTAPIGSAALLTGNHATQINTSTNPWFQGSLLSITAGSVTLIGKANEVPAQNIAVNVPNQVLGGFATNFSGEPVSVQSMRFLLSTSSTAGTTANSPFSAVTSITLVDENGNVVAGPVDAALGDGTTNAGGVAVPTTAYAMVHFTDTVTFPTGRHVYTIKGKIPSTWANGVTLNVFTKPSADWTNVTGQTTGNSVDLSGQATAFTMNQMTVKGASLAVNLSAQPAAMSVVRGIQNFVIANYQLDATQSGEDIRLSAMPVIINVGGAVTTDLTGCALWNGSTQLNTGSRVVNTFTNNSVKNFSFDNSLTIPKGTSVTLALSCNVAAGGTGTSYQAKHDNSDADWSVTGVTSGNSVTVAGGSLVVNSTDGGIMSVGSGSFTASVDSSSFATTTVAAGSTGVNIGVVKFRASTEAVTLTKLGLKLTAKGTASDITEAYIYNGSTQVGTLLFPQGSSITATSTLSMPVNLPANTDVLLTLKADLAPIGTGLSGTEGQPIALDVVSAEGNGQSSGTTYDIGQLTTGVAGVRMFKSFPTVAAGSNASTGVADGHLMRFQITANSAGSIGIADLSFALATSGTTTGVNTVVTSAKLNVYSDAAYSQSVSGNFGAATGQFGNTGGTNNTAGLVSSYTSASPLDFRATTNPLEVPAGQTYYFSLDAQVGGVTTGSSVTTTLLGDAAYIAAAHLATLQVSTTTGAEADTNNHFIWSGNATSTATIAGGTNDSDWANGFSILGLPAGGFSVTRGQ